jgi:2-methylisocitrate lyase-like PEP mutase family enzyme
MGAVVSAVAPKPVNIIMSAALGITVAEVAALGARRISVGSALSRVVWGSFMRAAKEIAEQGRFDSFAGGAPNAELNALFREDMKKRS